MSNIHEEWSSTPHEKRIEAFGALALQALLDSIERNDESAREGLTRFESPLQLELLRLARRLALVPRGADAVAVAVAFNLTSEEAVELLDALDAKTSERSGAPTLLVALRTRLACVVAGSPLDHRGAEIELRIPPADGLPSGVPETLSRKDDDA